MNKATSLVHTVFAFVFAGLISCDNQEQVAPTESTTFVARNAQAAGFTFNNALTANMQQNIFNYMYFFNGAGLGAADFDGDGYYDLFFAGNQVHDKVFRNIGELRFEDVTEHSGIVADGSWATGVSVADVNGDGKPDVLVSVVAALSAPGAESPKLYLNISTPGNIRFEEVAEVYGFAQEGYGSQVAWLDYDRDGDLDAYVLRHSEHKHGTFGPRARMAQQRHPTAGDLFLRNDNGRFVDVTDEVGIASSALGYGLGVIAEDLNNDGWPDIYVANDFHEDDYLYINDQQGGMREVLRSSMPHTSRFSMGVDAADLSGDGWPDVMVADMLPDDRAIRRTSAGDDPFDVQQMKRLNGYWNQYSRNVLQMSRGASIEDPRVPLFADQAIQAGVHATDWSWSVLLEDFNLDGNIDIFVSNGILGRSNDLDYIKFISADLNQSRLKSTTVGESDLRLAERMPVVKLRNCYFEASQAGGLSFGRSLVGEAGYSHGAVSVDLDNDGDRDLVTSDVNGLPQLLENCTAKESNDRLLLTLRGVPGNTEAIGAKVTVTLGNDANQVSSLVQAVRRVRGYLSSSDERLTFGYTKGYDVNDIRVDWPNGTTEHYSPDRGVSAYQILTQGGGQAVGDGILPPAALTASYSTTTGASIGLDFVHEETGTVDFDRQPLLPHTITEEGPALAVGDVNGDGLDDVFVGGAKRQGGAVYLQSASGTFALTLSRSVQNDSTYEDTDALFVDVDADGDADLIVLSGGGEYADDSEYHAPRLYRNEGTRGLVRDLGAFPQNVRLVGSRLLAEDLDGDGTAELLLFARGRSGRFAETPQSFVLANRNGRFVDITATNAPWLTTGGMITDALVVEAKGRHLLIARDFGPVTAHEVAPVGTIGAGQTIAASGMWRSLYAVPPTAQTNGAILMGNLGLNSRLAARGDTIVRLYVGDMDGNGTPEPLLTTMEHGTEGLFAGRDELVHQVVALRKRFPDYSTFSKSKLEDVLTPEARSKLVLFTVEGSASGVMGYGPGGFGAFRALPAAAQVGPIRVFGRLGAMGVFAFGNEQGVSVQRGAYDGIYGLCLDRVGERNAAIQVRDRPMDTGLQVAGAVRRSVDITVRGMPAVLVAVNSGPLYLIQQNIRKGKNQ